MGDLRKNFSWGEFACGCCGAVKVDDMLANGLQELRILACMPIDINSGFRCKSHNEAVGGEDTSQHKLGKAADVHVQGYSVPAMYGLALQVHVFRKGGIGIYPDEEFIHVDVRGVKARWGRVGGIYVTVGKAIEHFKEVMA